MERLFEGDNYLNEEELLRLYFVESICTLFNIVTSCLCLTQENLALHFLHLQEYVTLNEASALHLCMMQLRKEALLT